MLEKSAMMLKEHGLKTGALLELYYILRKIRKIKERAWYHAKERNRDGLLIAMDLKTLGLNVKAPFLINPDDEGLSRDLFIYGALREPFNVITISSIIKRFKPEVLDIGSNIGFFPLIEAASGARRIVAIEPVSETFTFLKKNVDIITKTFNIQVDTLNLAVSTQEGYANIYIPRLKNLASLHPNSKHDYIKVERVPTITLKKLVDERIISENVLLRMDLEGAEYDILTREKIPDSLRYISMEVHIPKPYNDAAMQRLIDRLSDHGFTLKVITAGKPISKPPSIMILGFKLWYKTIEYLSKKKNIKFYWSTGDLCTKTMKDVVKEYGCAHVHLFRR